MNPLISVIVPIYNVETYLKRCVDSIINQTYKNLEIILVNDESPDNCSHICDEYAKHDSRIKVIHQKNKGLSGARNSGLKIATGDYIGFIDSDDWIHEKMYETLLKHITSTSSDLSICSFIESDQIENETNYISSKEQILDKKGVMWNYLHYGFYVWRIIYSKELLKDFYFDENKKFIEDVFFGADLIEKVDKGVFIEIPLYFYNVENVSSLTKSNYNKGKFLSLDANLHVKKRINQTFKDDVELKEFIRDRLIGNCLYHLQNLYNKENRELDFDNTFKRRVKGVFNNNYSFFEFKSPLKTVVRLLNLRLLKYFYKIYYFKNQKTLLKN